MRHTVGTGYYKENGGDTRRDARPGDQMNLCIYPPATPCDAFPGSPVFLDLWAVVFWFPGLREQIQIALEEEEALLVATATLHNVSARQIGGSKWDET